jgi:pimeloyl-ACP methyl ester carboxylesterase
MLCTPLQRVFAIALATCISAASGQNAVAQIGARYRVPYDDNVYFDLVLQNGDIVSNTEQCVYVQLPNNVTQVNPLLLIFHGKYFDQYWDNPNTPLKHELKELMAEAASRGWIAVSMQAYGPLMTTFSYGNPEMDQRITAVIDYMASVHGIDKNRIYTFGHSMGGADALNYAARHQDPYDWRIAGAWSWSGVLDVTEIGMNNGNAVHDFFWATGDPTVDPLPYIAASSLKVSPECMTSCGVLGANHEENKSQIFNTAEIPVMITHASKFDICDAYCGYETAKHFQNMHLPMVETLPNLSLDPSYNTGHATTEDFDPYDICQFFSPSSLPDILPNRAYKTVAVKDGRYGYFDVTLENALEPGVFGFEFFPMSNVVSFPSPNDPSAPVTGVSELRFEVDNATPGFESPLVSNYYLLINIPSATSAMDVVLDNFTTTPVRVKFNGSLTLGYNYNSVRGILTLPSPGPGQHKWEIFP